MVVMDRTEYYKRSVLLHPHLRIYLEAWAFKGYLRPDFFVNLQRDMATWEPLNLIYPVGDPYFIHIHGGPGDMKTYLVIEPQMSPGLRESYTPLLQAFLAGPPQDKQGMARDEFEAAVDSFLHRTTTAKLSIFNGWSGHRKTFVETMDQLLLHLLMTRDVRGHGRLEPVFMDPYIDEIISTGAGRVDVLHKVWGEMGTNLVFPTTEALEGLAKGLGARKARPGSDPNKVLFRPGRGEAFPIHR